MNAQLAPSQSDRLELLGLLEEKARRRKYNRLEYVWPDKSNDAHNAAFPENQILARALYPKHMAHFELGLTKRIRAVFGANRSGKSESMCYEAALHMTGKYPQWWKGKRFDRPITCWAMGNSFASTRDSLQRKLTGIKGDLGTGFIPGADLAAPAWSNNGALDHIQVRHVNGGRSRLVFKSYEMGRDKFQADEVDLILMDEEPTDYGIYTECVTRTATTNGIVILAFTALKGITPLVCRFMPEFARGTDLEVAVDDGSSRGLTIIGWDDAPHLTEDAKKQMRSEYAPHEMSARTTGLPSIGSGSIYPVPERDFVVDAPKGGFPEHWPRVYALDPGYNRTAALWAAWDQTEDCVYLYSEHYRSYAEVEVHAAAIKARGVNIRGVSDNSYDVQGGNVIDQYRKNGLLIQPAQKSDKDGRIQQVYSRLSTGRLKVLSTLHNWLFEFRMYRRDEKGRLVKEHDHLMNCVAPNTMVITSNGAMRIDEMPRHGVVQSINGEWVDYINCGVTSEDSEMVELTMSDGSIACCTIDHRFLTPSGWVEAGQMEGMQCVTTSMSYHPRSKSIAANVTTCAGTIFRAMASVFTVAFGQTRMVKSPRASISTISTTFAQTMHCQTFPASTSGSMLADTRKVTGEAQHGRSVLAAHGIPALPAWRGIKSITQSAGRKSCTKRQSTLAANAAIRTSAQSVTTQPIISALARAVRFSTGMMGAIRKIGSALFAQENSLSNSSRIPKRHAVKPASLFCLSVRESPRSKTYCLHVPTTHAFALANGAIVHNCTEYLIQSGLTIARPQRRPPETVQSISQGYW